MIDTISNQTAGTATAENSAAADEQMARESWEFLYVTSGDVDVLSPDGFNIFIYSAKPDFIGDKGHLLARSQEKDSYEGRARAWAGAAAFTRDCKEECSRVQQGIDHLKRIEGAKGILFIPPLVMRGILARERAILAIAEKGMKRAA